MNGVYISNGRLCSRDSTDREARCCCCSQLCLGINFNIQPIYSMGYVKLRNRPQGWWPAPKRLREEVELTVNAARSQHDVLLLPWGACCISFSRRQIPMLECQSVFSSWKKSSRFYVVETSSFSCVYKAYEVMDMVPLCQSLPARAPWGEKCISLLILQKICKIRLESSQST